MAFGSLGLSWFLVALAIVVVLTILYGIARDDMQGHNPLFPQGTYSLRHPLGCLYAGIGLMSIGVTSEIFIPYYLQHIHGVRPLAAGYMTALMSAGWTTGSILMASRSPRFANRLFNIGTVISGLSLAALGALLPWFGLTTYYEMTWVLYIPLFGVGFGVGMIWPHLLTRVFRSARAGQENLASASITTLQLYAMSIGAAMAGMVTNAAGFNRGDLIGAQHSAAALLWVFAVVPFVFLFINRPVKQVV